MSLFFKIVLMYRYQQEGVIVLQCEDYCNVATQRFQLHSSGLFMTLYELCDV